MPPMKNSNTLQVEEGMGPKGNKYFFVRTDQGVIASKNKSEVDAYILDTGSVELGESMFGWRWVLRRSETAFYTNQSRGVSPTLSRSNDTPASAPVAQIVLTEGNVARLTELRNKLSEFVGDIDGILGQ